MRNIGIATIFVWIGFVAAISFMEAWLKFRAPGVTLPIGLGIGRLVFAALNKVEWVLSSICLLTVFPAKTVRTTTKLLLIIPITIILLQTLWLLPALDMRAEMLIRGDNVPDNNLHFYYIVAEVVKITLLILSGYLLFKSSIITSKHEKHLQ